MEPADLLSELRGLLDAHMADTDRRRRIISAVENRKMPEDLIIRRRETQPAQP